MSQVDIYLKGVNELLYKKIISLPVWLKRILSTGRLHLDKRLKTDQVKTYREATMDQLGSLMQNYVIKANPTFIENGVEQRRSIIFNAPIFMYGFINGEENYWGKQIFVNGKLVIDDGLVVNPNLALRFFNSEDVVEVRAKSDAKYYAAMSYDSSAFSKDMVVICQHHMYYQIFEKALPRTSMKMEPFTKQEKEVVFRHVQKRLQKIGFKKILRDLGVKRYKLFVVSGMAPNRIGIKQHSDLDLALAVDIESEEMLKNLIAYLSGEPLTSQDLAPWTTEPEVQDLLQAIFTNYNPNSLWNNPLFFKENLRKEDIHQILGKNVPDELIARIEKAFGGFFTPAMKSQKLIGPNYVLTYALDKKLKSLGIQENVDLFVGSVALPNQDFLNHRELLYDLLYTPQTAVLSEHAFDNQQYIRRSLGYLLTEKGMDYNQVAMCLLDQWFEYQARDHGHIKLLVDDDKGKNLNYKQIDGQVIATHAFLATMEELHKIVLTDKPFENEEWNNLAIAAQEKFIARAMEEFVTKLDEQLPYFDETQNLDEFWQFLLPYLAPLNEFLKELKLDLEKYYNDTEQFLRTGFGFSISNPKERESKATVHRQIGNFRLIADRVIYTTIHTWLTLTKQNQKQDLLNKARAKYAEYKTTQNPIGNMIMDLRKAEYFKDELIPGSIFYYLCTAPDSEIKDELGIDRQQVMLFLLLDLVGSSDRPTSISNIFDRHHEQVSKMKQLIGKLLSGEMTYRGFS